MADGRYPEDIIEHVRVDRADGHKVIWWERNGERSLGGIESTDLALYAADRLPFAGPVVVVAEGEKATDAILDAGLAAVGTVCGAPHVPCAAALGALRGHRVVLWPDNDGPGRDQMHGIAAALDGVAASVAWVDWPDAPDKGDAADADHATIARLVASAGPAMHTPSDNRATVQPPDIASTDDILGAVAETVARRGMAGESRAVKLVYLVVTTRLLDRIVSMAVKGPSSAGKSYLVEQVLDLFPPSAFHALSAMSEHALIYDDTDVRHRFLVIYEAAGLNGDITTYIIRSLLSEGRIRYTTVEKVKGGLRGRTIDRPGPTGLLTTTTEIRLHPENETRLLSLTVSDDPKQTAAILLAHARGTTDTVDLEPWHRLQEWLAAGPREVSIPYLVTLAEAIPPVAVRLRRDFPAVASLIRAHALLHRATRDTDGSGAIVATFADYAAVRELVADLVADAAERSVPASVRETVRTVSELTLGGGETTVLGIAGVLGIDKSAASRRVRAGLDRGYLRNLEDKRGRPARIALGDPLPEEQTVLPEPAELERLHGCTPVAGDIPNAPPDVSEPDPDDYPDGATSWDPDAPPAPVWAGWVTA